jgi:hypothetical protein
MIRRDISQAPDATHYCAHCGLTMQPADEVECPACDGDLCEPRPKTTRTSIGSMGSDVDVRVQKKETALSKARLALERARHSAGRSRSEAAHERVQKAADRVTRLSSELKALLLSKARTS